jgi:hypothetical protein
LSSSRRVKKGPGRRPLSLERQAFMELRAQVWSIRGAATPRPAPLKVRAADADGPRPAVQTGGPLTGWSLGGDLIVGKNQGSAIGTLVERQTRQVRLLHLPVRDSDSLHAAL